MSRVALLGGSFNPVHIAHQMICLWVLSTDQADEVWLMPAFHHPFDKPLEPFEHRLAMCALAAGLFAGGRVSVTGVEAQDEKESRTYFTLLRLIARHPKHELALVIGSDILQEREQWYRFEQIERMVRILVVGRSGYPAPEGAPVLPPISSTEIRGRLALGQEVSGLVPAPVLAYIKEHGLCGAPRPGHDPEQG